MFKEKRKTSRRPMRYTAWIAVEGKPLHGCALSDISQTGAKLDVENAEALPDHFVLLLSRSGRPRRKCRVVWRAPHQLGVEFERHFHEPVPVKIVRRAETKTPDDAPPAEVSESMKSAVDA